jgi:putative restriction endonuclease
LFDRAHDALVRTSAFDWLAAQVAISSDVLSRPILAEGFHYKGRRVPLLGPQGIFKPAVLDVPLSFTTTPNSPYDDAFGTDGLLQYRYRGTDPSHRDNRGLRFAMQERLPLVYFHGLVPGKYVATWPVFIVRDRPDSLAFSVAVDDAAHALPIGESLWVGREGTEARREYVTALARRRLHQRAFRERVLGAYRHQCALCRLKHDELLDAAHIIPDSDPEGEPVVSNGLALCRLHHSVFDRFFVGVRPDYIIQVRPDFLAESDGPTLRHAIQALHGKPIVVPRVKEHRPSIDLLATRYDQFLEVATGP